MEYILIRPIWDWKIIRLCGENKCVSYIIVSYQKSIPNEL